VAAQSAARLVGEAATRCAHRTTAAVLRALLGARKSLAADAIRELDAALLGALEAEPPGGVLLGAPGGGCLAQAERLWMSCLWLGDGLLATQGERAADSMCQLLATEAGSPEESNTSRD
jgi:hypothetical protein